MNNVYKTMDLYTAWLFEVNSQCNRLDGIKNIMGIKIIHNNEYLFYSILDDCFFRVFPLDNSTSTIGKDFHGRLFVQIYNDQKPLWNFGTELYNYINKDYITKKEIIEIKKNNKWLFGYQSDFDYKLLKTDTTVDYENPFAIEENTTDTVKIYEEKKKRLITYDNNHIYGPKQIKKLIKK